MVKSKKNKSDLIRSKVKMSNPTRSSIKMIRSKEFESNLIILRKKMTKS